MLVQLKQPQMQKLPKMLRMLEQHKLPLMQPQPPIWLLPPPLHNWLLKQLPRLLQMLLPKPLQTKLLLSLQKLQQMPLLHKLLLILLRRQPLTRLPRMLKRLQMLKPHAKQRLQRKPPLMQQLH
jgi:hypothetical protein